MRFFRRFLLGMLIVSSPMAALVIYMHIANRLPIETASPYPRRVAAEKRLDDRLQAEYARGYADGLKAKKVRP